MSSLQEYVLIGSEHKTIEVYRREGDRVELERIGVRFSFDEMYRRIQL